MFDVGFWELVLIGIMGLVILGPERLPVAIRTVRSWIAGARRFSDTVKSELTEELRVHELHENLKKAEQTDLKNLSPEVAESLKTLKEAAASVNQPFKDLAEHNLTEQDSEQQAKKIAPSETKQLQENSTANATTKLEEQANVIPNDKA